jgi:CRISPR/Cas system endoribonuclease Cas6 (RAMP superfamily)
MLGYDLCSAVFVLRPQRMFPAHHHFLGRMAQKLFLLMLTEAGYAALATELHDLNGALPFTVSDLFQNGSEHYWMRVTGLTPTLCQALQHLVQLLPGRTLEMPPRDSVDEAVWRVNVAAAVITQHEWTGASTYGTLMREGWRNPPHNALTLDFMTPTALKSVGVYRSFPVPALVFRLLYERLLKVKDIPLPFQPEVAYLETFADYWMEVAAYQIECGPIPLKMGEVAAFHGWVTYRFLPGNEDFRKRAERQQAKHNDSSLMVTYRDIQRQREQYSCLVNLLATFVFYSGLGMYTGQGMGMVRKVERNDR